MSWQPRQPMTWKWFQQRYKFDQIAVGCAEQAAQGRKLMYIVGPFSDNTVEIVSCKGSVAPPKAKKARTPKQPKAASVEPEKEATE